MRDPSFKPSSMVPVLIGMDHLSGTCSSMVIDFATGLAMDSHEQQPEVYQLEVHPKGHYVMDIVYFLARGHEG